MSSINFPKQKPARDELELPKSHLSLLARDTSKRAKTAQLEILSAESAEELAIAIAKFNGVLKDASAAWSTMAELTRHWAH
jgi:hypothetical protein